jgi:hypothetical protein
MTYKPFSLELTIQIAVSDKDEKKDFCTNLFGVGTGTARHGTG